MFKTDSHGAVLIPVLKKHIIVAVPTERLLRELKIHELNIFAKGHMTLIVFISEITLKDVENESTY